MKTLFVDLDGVVNSSQERISALRSGYCSVVLDPCKIERLKQITDATDCQIVLASSWRRFWTSNPIDSAGVEINVAFQACGLRITDKTPDFREGTRDREVAAWLREHPEVREYCILDDKDHAWSAQNRAHWVQTDGAVGLNDETVFLAIDVLRGNLIPIPKETLWQKIKRVWQQWKEERW